MSGAKKKRRHSLLITLPVVGGAVAYLWFVYLPGQREIEKLKQERDAMISVVTGSEKVRDSIAAVNKDMAETQAFTAKWSHEPAGSQMASRLFGDVAAAMKASGVMTTQFTPEEAVQYEQLERLPLKLECRGTYPQITDLVRRIEVLPYRVWIDELMFERVSQDSEDLTCQLTLAVFTNKKGKSD